MAGLNELIQIYKRGEKTLNEFLCVDGDQEILVTEKLDAYRFSFEKNNGKLQYFKRNDSQPIDKIDRLINDLYEKAITYFEELEPSIIRYIPEGFRFGFSYFPSKKPLRIEYSTLPKNHLVLTDISQRDPQSQKITKMWDDIKYLERWSSTLDVAPPPIIYKGRLLTEQFLFIEEILKGSDKIDAMFAEHITAVFGELYTKNNIIEGVVIKTPYGIAQLKDPSFKLFEKEKISKENRDFYDIIILELHNFLTKRGIPKHISKLKTDERYIECVSEIFNEFVTEGNIDPNSDPIFLTPNIIGSKGKIGLKFIQNIKTRELIESNKLYEELFKVFLNVLRRERKPHGLLTESTIHSLNKYIEDISNITNVNIISEYAKTVDGNDDLEWLMEYDIKEDELLDDTGINPEKIDIDTPISLESDKLPESPIWDNLIVKSFNQPLLYKEVVGGIPITVFIDSFNPINNYHLETIKNEYNESGRKSFLLNIDIDNQLDDSFKWRIDSELSTKIINKVAHDNSKFIIGYFSLDINTLHRIHNILTENTQGVKLIPYKFIIDKNQLDYYTLQFQYEKALGNRLNFPESLVVNSFTDENEYNVLKSLQKNNPVEFKKHVPDSVVQFWEQIYKDWFAWANK